MEFLTALLKSMPGAVGQGLIWGIMAIGVYITYRILDVADLTVDGSLATGGAACVLLALNGVNIWIATLCAILAGMLAGLVTGLLHTRCGIPAILAGILTQLALYSVNLRIMGWGTATGTQATLPIRVDNYALLVSSRHIRAAGLNNPLFLLALLVAAVIAVLYWFFGTELGCALRATGSNSSMSRAQGINTDTTKVLGLMLSNGLVALSGALLAQYQGSATIDMGRGAIVIGLAAVIIGQVLLSRIFHNFSLKLLSAVIGAIIYYMVIQVVLRLGLDPNDLKLLTALVVAVFLSIPYWKGKYLHAKVKTGGGVRHRPAEHSHHPVRAAHRLRTGEHHGHRLGQVEVGGHGPHHPPLRRCGGHGGLCRRNGRLRRGADNKNCFLSGDAALVADGGSAGVSGAGRWVPVADPAAAGSKAVGRKKS